MLSVLIRELVCPAVDMYTVDIYIEDGLDENHTITAAISLLGICIAKGEQIKDQIYAYRLFRR